MSVNSGALQHGGTNNRIEAWGVATTGENANLHTFYLALVCRTQGTNVKGFT